MKETTTAFRSPSLVVRGLVAGLVAAAATLGLLIGIGRRGGTAWRPLNSAAHLVLGSTADGLWAFHGDVTPVGGLVVLTLSVVAGIAVARLAGSLRSKHVIAAALGVSLLAYLFHVHVAARSPGGLSDLLSNGELRALYLTCALALATGLRFSFSVSKQAEDGRSGS